MARAKKNQKTGKQYTTREIILLLALLFVAILYFYFTYFFTPITEEIGQLKADTETLRMEYTARKSLIAKKETLLQELEEHDQNLKSLKSLYFKTSHQEHFIKVLETELLDEEDLDVSSLSFTGANPFAEFISEAEGSVYLETSVVSFPYAGTYEGLEELIGKLEQYPQIIRINSLDITHMPAEASSEEDEESGEPYYQGNLNIEFFTIPQNYSFPWEIDVPSYEDADEYTQGLFEYDDGNFGLPPFLVEREEAPEDTGDDEYVFTPVEEEPEESENEETDPDENPDEEEIVDKDPVQGENKPADPEKEELMTYAVKPGDTIFSISMRFYGTQYRVQEIMAINKIYDPTTLQSGSVILLPSI